MAVLKLASGRGAFLRQRLDSGLQWIGDKTADATAPVPSNDLWDYPEKTGANGEGLFQPGVFVDPKEFVWISTVRIMLNDDAVNWNLYLTDGEGAAGGNKVDTVINDIPIANGTGSALVYVRLALRRSENIRFTTAAAITGKSWVTVEIIPVRKLYGRPVSD